MARKIVSDDIAICKEVLLMMVDENDTNNSSELDNYSSSKENKCRDQAHLESF